MDCRVVSNTGTTVRRRNAGRTRNTRGKSILTGAVLARSVIAARLVARCGERLVPRLYAHLNPMPYQKAAAMEVALADSLRKRGFLVYGGH